MSTLAFAHVGLTCKDPLTIERFYTKYFGFQRVRVVPLGDDELVYTRSGNLTLEIFKAKEERPISPPSGGKTRRPSSSRTITIKARGSRAMASRSSRGSSLRGSSCE